MLETTPAPVAERRHVLDRLEALPTIPLVAQQVGELVNDPRSDANKIVAALRGDQSLTAKILKLVNSPYYGIPGGVSDIGRAISVIGFNTLHQLVLTVSVFEALRGPRGGAALDPRELWKHALGCGLVSELVARRINYPQPDTCFTAGLLHDVGKVALLHAAPESFQLAVTDARTRQVPLQEAERACGLPAHDQVGAHLARKWRFPQKIAAPIEHAYRAEPRDRAGLPQSLHPVVDMVMLGNQLCRRFAIGDAGEGLVPDIDPRLLDRLGLVGYDVENLRGELLRSIDRSRAFRELFESS
jgi:putative nucleotidyltransferase with HDIG domain